MVLTRPKASAKATPGPSAEAAPVGEGEAEVQSQDQQQHFDDFAKDWWNPKGRLRSLHKITPLRFNYFNDIAMEELGGLRGKRVLDIGCGGGLLSERFAKAGAVVSGIDLSKTAIEVAKEHARKEGLEIDYDAISIADKVMDSEGEFDLIVCSEVLEHVDDLRSFVAESCKALRPGGFFFFSTINKTFKARFLAIFVVEDLLGVLPSGTHDPEMFVRPSELALMMEEGNVRIEELKGMSFSPLSFSFRISKDTSVNYLGFGVKNKDI